MALQRTIGLQRCRLVNRRAEWGLTLPALACARAALSNVEGRRRIAAGVFFPPCGEGISERRISRDGPARGLQKRTSGRRPRAQPKGRMRGLLAPPMALAGTRVDGPWNIALNSSLNVARGWARKSTWLPSVTT